MIFRLHNFRQAFPRAHQRSVAKAACAAKAAPADRGLRGLEEVFSDVFPISNLNINALIEYVGFEVGIWECGCGEFKELGGPAVLCSTCKQEVTYKEKYKLSECRQKGLTYSDPIKIMVRLVLFDREVVDVGARTLKYLQDKIIIEEVKRLSAEVEELKSIQTF